MEPNEQPIEKSSEVGAFRYFVLTTLATVLLPAVILSVPIIVLGCISPYILILGPTLFGLWKLAMWLKNRVLPRFHTAMLEDRLPKNSFVLYLPFFLPFLYVLAVTACGFSDIWATMSDRNEFFLWAFVLYCLPLVVATFLMLVGYGIESMAFFPLLATFTVAVGGVYYFGRYSPRRKRHVPAVATLSVLCLVFGAVTIAIHGQMCEYSMGRGYGIDKVRETYYDPTVRDETDLLPYIPFSTNNKLETIEGDVGLSIESDHPRIHGALALYPVYAAAVQATYKNMKEKDVEPIVRGGTSPQAFSALVNGEADMVFMIRPSEKQYKEAEAAGKTLVVTPIGREAFVFFVSTTNPIDELSSDQIRNIYTKTTTRWSELGGKNEKILPFQRPEGSGSQTAMQVFMGTHQLARPIKEEYQELMGGIVNRVADYRNYGNSIGFSFRYYVEGMFKHVGVKLLTVDGIAPTPENIRNESYPMVGEIVVVTAGSENPNVPKFIEWFLSPTGQELLDRIGYVSLSSTPP